MSRATLPFVKMRCEADGSRVRVASTRQAEGDTPFADLAVTLSGIYAELKGWQSGIAALLGFIALIVGALFNFKLNRRRDDALRREEMLSVAIAIYGEILMLRTEVARLAVFVSHIMRLAEMNSARNSDINSVTNKNYLILLYTLA